MALRKRAILWAPTAPQTAAANRVATELGLESEPSDIRGRFVLKTSRTTVLLLDVAKDGSRVEPSMSSWIRVSSDRAAL